MNNSQGNNDGRPSSSTSSIAASPAQVVPPNSPSLYDIFGSTGPSAILIALVGTRWAISTVGFVLNLLLVWITIRTKSLNGTCNLFIALNALSSALYQSSNSVSLFIVLSGLNFIPLRICLYLMVYAILSITLGLCTIFLISFDRLLGVLFPVLFGSNQKSKMFVGCSLAISLAYSLYVLWQCWEVSMAVPNMPVICSISDCYGKEVGHMIFRNSMILISLSSLNYVIIWIGLKWKSANSNYGKASRSYTEKIFKSLSVITGMVLFGWMLNATVRFLMPLWPTVTQLQNFYISSALGCTTNIVLALNAPVLYAFSKDYRKAFSNFLHGLESSGSAAWAEKRSAGAAAAERQASLRRANIEALANK